MDLVTALETAKTLQNFVMGDGLEEAIADASLDAAQAATHKARLAHDSRGQVWSAVNHSAQPCAARADAVLQGQDVGPSFVTMGNDFQASAPIGFGNGKTWVSFDGGRLEGLLASVALASKYKSEQEARARALNYPVGKWPLLPLQGKVVAENPGALEIYQANWDFRSADDSKAFFSDIVRSLTQTTDKSEVQLGPINLPGSDQAFGVMFSNPNVESEQSLDIDFRVSGTVVQVGIRGGQSLSQTYVVGVASAALNRIQRACH